KALKDLQANGYDISFAESVRADGGCVMRGNDLLCGAPDVMVTDTLSGNIFMKVFSSFTTGGDYEAQGFGYGPGVGEDYDRKILILSRASGSPVVANALKYAYDVVKGDVTKVSKDEFKNVKNAKYDDIIA
ncbi:glycine reductase, partial [Casaltella massiliensis]|nr:glycine reductase [Casaltella massiliensis]